MGVASWTRVIKNVWRSSTRKKSRYRVPQPFLTRMILISIIDATVYVGGLDEKVTENVLWELFLQAGPVGMF